MDHLFAQGKMDEAIPAVEMIRQAGLLAGIAAHNPEVIKWAEKNLDVDYYMCSYYNSESRDEKEEHDTGAEEVFRDKDRKIMTELIQNLSRPVIHYKIMAAGRNDPLQAIAYAVEYMRPCDAICVGIYRGDSPNVLEEDVKLFLAQLRNRCKI